MKMIMFILCISWVIAFFTIVIIDKNNKIETAKATSIVIDTAISYKDSLKNIKHRINYYKRIKNQRLINHTIEKYNEMAQRHNQQLISITCSKK